MNVYVVTVVVILRFHVLRTNMWHKLLKQIGYLLFHFFVAFSKGDDFPFQLFFFFVKYVVTDFVTDGGTDFFMFG